MKKAKNKAKKPVAKKAVAKVAPKAKPKSSPKSKPAAKVVAKPSSKAPIKKSAKAVDKPKTTAKPVVAAKPTAKAAPAKVELAKSVKTKGNSVVSQEAPKGRSRLNKEELKFFETLLNEKKETLIQELGYLEDNSMRLNSKDGAGDLSSHAYHLADHATETQDREQAFHMASREGRYLFYIEEAMDRVRAGTYGICKKCGNLIPKARLEAVPTAKMCISCKSKQEQAAEVEAAA